MKVKFSKKFGKNYDKAPFKIRKAFDSRLEQLLVDKFYPSLNNHALTGKYKGFRSINITGDWRAVFRELKSGEIVYFDLLGTHSKLYK
ncbi:MAG: hypothetical protein US62_C0009G0016 [Candidatus Woesebacteria bacterium GW2011_GWA1_37_8]|uniref:Plasmid stabilization system n=2 Tax=Candidatus Woeseibacteriota TaxID=1752722 RepID=A0A0G0L3X7_9BACT|nr:MAG: hypothetical protein US39_C0002G0056 [Microgenomates group bacterium GW2011_GWC1_37_12b]KKQ45785.1 MAG: hypothetical protein US62_C0009G0016 [Candidatus Woesebacteria bacterium GW2011_GWA1_37_8]KKQ86673.1 MAG: hypothetical protein UT10_C0019G0033 [Candidatus Woesebacteria bacterium GW2011_GWB1_38_8b]